MRSSAAGVAVGLDLRKQRVGRAPVLLGNGMQRHLVAQVHPSDPAIQRAIPALRLLTVIQKNGLSAIA